MLIHRQRKKITSYIKDDLEISSDDFDEENSDQPYETDDSDEEAFDEETDKK